MNDDEFTWKAITIVITFFLLFVAAEVFRGEE